jgi:hypothetical protein
MNLMFRWQNSFTQIAYPAVRKFRKEGDYQEESNTRDNERRLTGAREVLSGFKKELLFNTGI